MSEDGVYPRVEGVAHPNIFLCPRDVKLETTLRQPVPTYIDRSVSFVALMLFVVWSKWTKIGL